jgi:hypothetical protein
MTPSIMLEVTLNNMPEKSPEPDVASLGRRETYLPYGLESADNSEVII